MGRVVRLILNFGDCCSVEWLLKSSNSDILSSFQNMVRLRTFQSSLVGFSVIFSAEMLMGEVYEITQEMRQSKSVVLKSLQPMPK